jgi:exosortase
LAAFWHGLPDKPLFAALAVSWLALFHFLGNSTLGYENTPSLFGWLDWMYTVGADDAHGKLIPFVVLVLVWVRRRPLMLVAKGPWWGGVGLVVAGLALHMVGFIVQQARLSVVGFFLGFYGLMGWVWGWRWLKACFFPYFLFVFCLPLGGTLGESLTFPLRMLVTQISVAMAHLLAIDVVRQGTQLLGAGGFNFDVGPACSGIRSLTALVALTTIYGFLTFTTGWKRLLMVILAVPLAVVGNVARITGVIITAEAFGERAGTQFHDWAGFVTFLVALVCVMGLGYWLREKEPAPPLESQAA